MSSTRVRRGPGAGAGAAPPGRRTRGPGRASPRRVAGRVPRGRRGGRRRSRRDRAGGTQPSAPRSSAAAVSRPAGTWWTPSASRSRRRAGGPERRGRSATSASTARPRSSTPGTEPGVLAEVAGVGEGEPGEQRGGQGVRDPEPVPVDRGAQDRGAGGSAAPGVAEPRGAPRPLGLVDAGHEHRASRGHVDEELAEPGPRRGGLDGRGRPVDLARREPVGQADDGHPGSGPARGDVGVQEGGVHGGEDADALRGPGPAQRRQQGGADGVEPDDDHGAVRAVSGVPEGGDEGGVGRAGERGGPRRGPPGRGGPRGGHRGAAARRGPGRGCSRRGGARRR